MFGNAAQRNDLTKRLIVGVKKMEASIADKYPEGFFHWLPKNSKVYREFERRALQMSRTNRKRYSARTIVETMRWTSDIADSGTTFKIDDKMTPGMARLWMATYGRAHPKFFELRDTLGRNL